MNANGGSDGCHLTIFLDKFSSNRFNFNRKDGKKRTPLHLAASKGDVGVLEGLLSSSEADPNLVDTVDWTPLCLAIRDEKFAAA